MTIKEKIELEATDYSCGFDQAYLAVIHGADFAIKSVIEMLEEKRDKSETLTRAAAIVYIINLLKSEI